MTFISYIPKSLNVQDVNAVNGNFQNLTVSASANISGLVLQSDLNANNFNINNVNTVNTSNLNVSTSATITGLTLGSDLNANNFKIINVSELQATSVNINNGLIFTDTVNNRVGIGTTTPATPLHVVGDVRIDGNFTVNGNLTYVNTTNLNVTDNVIVINSGETGAGVTLGTAGIEIDRGTLTNAQIIFDEGTDTFIFRLADGTLLPIQASDAKVNTINGAYPIPVALNKGFTTSVTVTETTATLKQEVTPDNANGFLTYVEGVHIIANNPTGSGVTLTFEIRALLDDGTEATLVTQNVTEGTTFDDWLRWIYDAVPNGRKIKAIRLYAYCSATPTAGSEPTVQLERVTGIQQ